MHDVSYNIAFYVALASALVLSALSLCREMKVRLPSPVDRWARPRGVLDRLVLALAAIALLVLFLWLTRITR